MLIFSTEINQRIIEEVGFEYGPRLKESISTFKVLNSILELKPIIAKYISIWISIPYDVRFNFLRYSEALRALRDCTDSFFILTNNEPLEPCFCLHLKRALECDPLIFDVHNFLGRKLNNGLNDGIRNFEVLVEDLILLRDKRPKRILELVLPGGDFEGNRFAEGLLKSNHRHHGDLPRCIYSLGHEHLELLTGTRTVDAFPGVPIGEQYNVPIDHQTFNGAMMSDFYG